ncbi:MAG: FAD-linked oxidase C-terminal domain-containing protein [Pseudomonadota bacterium]
MTVQTAIAELSTVLGDGLSLSKADLVAHGASEAYFAATPPDAVAYPRTTDEVAAIVRTCAAHGAPVIPWGTGTSLEGHALALSGGVTVDFSRMNKVLKINAEDMDVVVQPGVTREALNEELRATGLFFPIDPGANAALGGMVATRASGTTAVRYGTMRDNVMGLEVVLADGRVIRTGTRARKSSAGYDLTALFVGSEGTLGLMTELTLKLHGQPEAISAAVCAFDSVTDAVNTVIATIQMGIGVARIELLDAATAQSFNAYAGATFPAKPHLMLEFHGSETAVSEDAQRFGELAEEYGASGFQRAERPEDRNRLWTMRHQATYAIKALRPGADILVTDICVPISELAQAVDETAADIAASALQGPILGHVGDGNFHALLLVDPKAPEELDEAKRISDRMVERSLRLGGTATGEHGVGIGKLGFMEREHGDGWAIMGDVKKALDPQNILNPGKVVRVN